MRKIVITVLFVVTVDSVCCVKKIVKVNFCLFQCVKIWWDYIYNARDYSPDRRYKSANHCINPIFPQENSKAAACFQNLLLFLIGLLAIYKPAKNKENRVDRVLIINNKVQVIWYRFSY